MSIDVPQGSTCEPIVFLLYMNDLFRALVSMQTVPFFADDTTFRDISDEIDIE